MIEISASLLAANFAHLIGDIQKIPQTDFLHVDVMDGHFVPNLTIGVPVLQSLKAATDIRLDAHLMITKPRILLRDFCKAQPDRITVHVESDSNEGLEEAFSIMDDYGVKKGLALRPITKASAVLPFIKSMDMILVMTVEPGFGGQSFMMEQLETIRDIKALCMKHNPNCVIQVDGGINLETAPLVKEAGAEILVAGSAVFGASHPNTAVEELRNC
ncbi:MAG: ribulose-phosphate 3-epimerase [Eubacteriales bacterium]